MIPKFRAWDKEAKVMREIKALIWEENNLIAHCPPRGHEYDEWFTVVLQGCKYQLMQSTGLKDKNGMEIYEGDIADITDYKNGNEFRGVISFKNGSYVVESKIATHYRFIDYDIEIIGDIYQNPELLEGE